MLGKNIRYYRIQKNYTQEYLAESVGVQKMTISNYENDKREPDIQVIKKICKVLDVSLNRFMAYQPLRGEEIILNGKFRKNDNLSSAQEQQIIEQIKYSIERYLQVADLLGNGCIDTGNLAHSLYDPDPDLDNAAWRLRKILGLPERGPIGNLIQNLENSNIYLINIKIMNSDFSGYSCWIGQIPVIAYNDSMTMERQRFTIAHELVHLFLEKEHKLSEKKVDDIAGRFLLPTKDCRRELGNKRKNIGISDIRFVHDEYGVSGQCVVLRARQAAVINSETYRRVSDSSITSNMRKESPSRLKQLVCRAYNDDEIGLSKVSELLDIPYAEAMELCGMEGVSE